MKKAALPTPTAINTLHRGDILKAVVPKPASPKKAKKAETVRTEIIANNWLELKWLPASPSTSKSAPISASKASPASPKKLITNWKSITVQPMAAAIAKNINITVASKKFDKNSIGPKRIRGGVRAQKSTDT